MGTQTSHRSEAEGKAKQTQESEASYIFDFTCRIRRYNIFLDEVTPEQLTPAFLEDYMNLPPSYFDLKNRAPEKFNQFLRRWGTHYITQASFGGKFSLIRQSMKSASETEEEWSAKMEKSMSMLFDARSKSYKGKYENGIGFGTVEAKASVKGRETQSKDEISTAEKAEEEASSARKSAQSFSLDDIVVEGGHQRVASILADKNREGFKTEFKNWLDSIPEYPKGYDFKFVELSELININFRSYLKGKFTPCWGMKSLEKGPDCPKDHPKCMYTGR